MEVDHLLPNLLRNFRNWGEALFQGS